MKLSFNNLIILELMLSFLLISTCRASSLDLNTALNMFYKCNPLILSKKAEYKKAINEYEKALKQLYPELNFFISATRSGESIKELSGSRSIFTGSLNRTIKYYQTLYSSGVNLTIPVYNRKLRLLAKQTFLMKKIACLKYMKQVRDIYFEVIKTYINLLKAKEIYQLSKKNYKLSKMQLKFIKNRFDAGLTIKTDVLRGELRVKQEEKNLIIAKNNYKLLMLALNKVIGWNINKHFDNYKKINFKKLVPIVPKINDYKNRLEYKIQSELLNLSRLQKKLAISEKYPLLSLTGNYSKTGQDFLPDKNTSSSLMLRLNYTLFDSGKINAGIKAQYFNEKAVRHQLASLKLNLNFEISSKYLKVKEMKDKLEVIKKSVTLANKNYEIIKQHYQNGLVTVIDLTEAEVQKFSSESSFLNAKYDYYISILELYYSTGKIFKKISRIFQR